MIIITGASALAWWNTPTLFKHEEIPPEQFTAWLKMDEKMRRYATGRKNRRYVDERILARLPFDLKGIPLPIEVETDYGTMRTSPFARVHRLSRKPDASLLQALGNDLYVASPSLALVQASRRRSLTATIALMYEACGIYAEPSVTDLVRPLLEACKAQASGAKQPSQFFRKDEDDPWKPVFDRNGDPSSMWKRPQLITTEQLRIELETMQCVDGLPQARRAAQFVHDRSGSWLETAWALFALLPPRCGGAGYPAPLFNERVTFTPEAELLAGMSYCKCDMLWPEQNAVVELNGMAYHADRAGFKEASGRRAALESMGYSVLEITYDQMCDITQLEILLDMMSTRLGLKPAKRSTKQIERRKKLHQELFGQPESSE
ncbi:MULTISPECIES: PDDEXK family nuclease [Enorma]|uniref:hypothetical protein n=1 Tax=Enorma TaxID=1472762 RepID=UPI00034857CF|nr:MULTISPECIES: hypothetical protein [Enorma]